MLVAIIILGVLCAALLALVVWKNFLRPGDVNSALLLKADLTQINESMNQLKEGLQKQLTEQLGTSNKQMSTQHAQNVKIIQDITRQLTGIERTNKSVADV